MFIDGPRPTLGDGPAPGEQTAVRPDSSEAALAEKVNQLTGGSDLTALHTLAAAYAEAGRFGDATATARRALQLGAALKNSELTATLEKEVKLYEANNPMRDKHPR